MCRGDPDPRQKKNKKRIRSMLLIKYIAFGIILSLFIHYYTVFVLFVLTLKLLLDRLTTPMPAIR